MPHPTCTRRSLLHAARVGTPAIRDIKRLGEEPGPLGANGAALTSLMITDATGVQAASPTPTPMRPMANCSAFCESPVTAVMTLHSAIAGASTALL